MTMRILHGGIAGNRSAAVRFLLAATLFALLFCSGKAGSVEWQPRAMLQSQEMPLLPYLDYYIDESLSLDIEEAADPARANAYQPLVLEKLPRTEGITWLRFTIAPQPADMKPATFLLDMGQSIPGVPVLFDPVHNELSGALEWRENTPAQRNILLLPETGSQAIICYIRLNGLPGPWFSPMIRTPQNAAGNWTSLSRTGAILALGVVMLLCLLRGMSENGQWRIWTALYVAVALVQALLGMPSISASASIGSLAAVLAPGVALMLLPHVGRHLMRTPKNSRALDIQLLLLSLPGAALALWPLLPGWAWLERWLDLWPAGAILFVPTALGAWITGLGGARRFLIGCLLPPLFVAVSLVGLDFGVLPNFLASLPLWGVAISALLIAATRSPWEMNSPLDKPAKKKAKKDKPELLPQPLPATMPDEDKDTVINLEHPLDDPNLRIIEADPYAGMTAVHEQEASAASTHEAPVQAVQKEENVPETTGDSDWNLRESALRVPLDELLREGAALGQCSLPPAVRQYAEKMIDAGNRMAEIMSNPAHMPESGGVASAEPPNGVFNLQRMLRDAHDSVAVSAEQTGTALSWYMPPHLCQLYLGNDSELCVVLRMLIESAVRATPKGAVHVSARRAPESSDPGHILFTIRDNGGGIPPRERSSLALARAWEVAARHGGYLAMESGPQGTVITFSLRLQPVEEEEDDTTPAAPHVVIASEDGFMRRELAKMIEALPCRVSEAATMHEVLVCQSLDPASLLIAHGRLAMPSAADMAHEFSALATQAGFSQCSILAITEDDSQWSLLKPSGFTHAMIEPVDEDALRETVSSLVSTQQKNTQTGDSAGNLPDTQQKDTLTAVETPAQDEPAAEKEDAIPDIFSGNGAANPGPPVAGDTRGDLAQVPGEAESIFEGPAWLDENRKETSGVSAGKDASGIAAPTPTDVCADGNAPATRVVDDSFDAEILSEAFEDWVGEPEPVKPPKMDPLEEAAAASPQVYDISEAIEWVGEPQPIKPETVQGNQAAGNGHKDNSAPLTDFIVGVERSSAAAGAGQPEQLNKTSTVDQPHCSQHDGSGGGKVASSNDSPVAGDTDKIVSDAAGASIQEELPADMDPVFRELLHKLEASSRTAREAFESRNPMAVARATATLAAEADSHGQRVVARLARCVEQAASKNDMDALKDLLPELVMAVERTRIAFTQKKPF